jgi:hypothetical protein
MAEPAEVAGSWNVTVSGRQCALTLTTTRVEAANAYALDGAACLSDLLPSPVAGWRPAPDGIELAGDDRRTLVLFADQGDGTGRATLAGDVVTLRRSGGSAGKK